MANQQIFEDLKRARQLEYALAKDDFGLFVQASWHVLEPNSELKWNWHHDYICEHLQAVKAGEITRLIINIAPRTTKSILASIDFPAWIWISEPNTRFLFGSYADDISTKLSILRRNLIESQWYQRGYGKSFQLSSDVNTKSEFSNNHTGKMRALGIKGAVTGDGGDYIIIDDPHNPRGAESEVEREAICQNFDLGWSTRLNDKKTGRIIVIMQRLHEADLTGHLLEKNLGYTHIKIPMIAEEHEVLVFPISKRKVERNAGDLMHPERDGPAEIEAQKKALGPYGFSGQLQQSPSPKSGGLFTADMFDFVELPKDFDYTFITGDTAYNDKQENDFSSFSAWGVKANELYLIDVFHKQIKAAEIEIPLVAFIKRFSSYGFRGAYIEPKGHGIYLNQALPKLGLLVPSTEQLKEFYADRKHSKVERANNAVPNLANRKIHINEILSEKEILLNEVLKFPKAAHDDFCENVIDAIKLVFARPLSIFDVL